MSSLLHAANAGLENIINNAQGTILTTAEKMKLSSFLIEILILYKHFLFLNKHYSFVLCRPVLAIVEVEVQEVNEAARDNVFREVSSFQGPLDATVVVNLLSPTPEEKNEFPEDLRTELMQMFEDYGTVVLVR